MECKKMNEIESLNLIASMIKNARTNQQAKVNSRIILLWGYVSVVATVIVWFLKLREVPYASIVWIICPLINLPLSAYIYSKDRVAVKSYIDQSIDYIAILIAALCLLVGLSTLITNYPALYIEGLLVGSLIVIIGILIKFKPFVLFGTLGILVSHSLLVVDSPLIQIPVFALILVLTMIIPGHFLKHTIADHV